MLNSDIKKWTVLLMKLSGMLLAVSVSAKLVAGYVVRGWRRLRDKRNFSVDVIAPNYGPAMVVSTEDFLEEPDPVGKILEDSYHTRIFRRVAWLDALRRASIAVSLCVMAAAFVLWLLSPGED